MFRIFKLLLIFALIGLLIAGAWLWHFSSTVLTLPNTPYEFRLKSGTTLRSAAGQFKQAGLMRNTISFEMLARILGKSGKLKAGTYVLDKPLTPLGLLEKIISGDVTQLEITFIEGHTFAQMRKRLDEIEDLKHETTKLSDAEVLKLVGATETNPEGLFMPDTYQFSKGMTDLALLKRAYQTMQNHLNEAWGKRAPNLPYKNPYEALIMASIVEKETGLKSERPGIAAVFTNRLRIGMRLQTDPSIIYGLGAKYRGKIYRSDLDNDTPYNTYTRAGLPPTPIAMPSRAAIDAVMQPDTSKALYFVASPKGDGSHIFSNSLREHNSAVSKYRAAAK
ncbi:MAG: endolytic transglycosylase MltG [Burkholderiales bacterium]